MRYLRHHKLRAIFPAILIALIFSLTAAAQDDCPAERAVIMTVQSNPSPSLPGQAVTFGAFVEPVMGISIPSGQVQVLDGSTDVGTFPLQQSQIHFTRVFTDAGAHVLSVTYGGDSTYCGKSVV